MSNIAYRELSLLLSCVCETFKQLASIIIGDYHFLISLFSNFVKKHRIPWGELELFSDIVTFNYGENSNLTFSKLFIVFQRTFLLYFGISVTYITCFCFWVHRQLCSLIWAAVYGYFWQLCSLIWAAVMGNSGNYVVWFGLLLWVIQAIM